MVTLIGYLKRPEGVSREDFQKWWIEKHVPYVKQVPGLRRYVVHVIKKGFHARAEGATVDDEPEFDGVAELWFDDEESLKKAWASPKGMEDLAHFAKHIGHSVSVIADPIVMIPGP